MERKHGILMRSPLELALNVLWKKCLHLSLVLCPFICPLALCVSVFQKPSSIKHISCLINKYSISVHSGCLWYWAYLCFSILKDHFAVVVSCFGWITFHPNSIFFLFFHSYGGFTDTFDLLAISKTFPKYSANYPEGSLTSRAAYHLNPCYVKNKYLQIKLGWMNQMCSFLKSGGFVVEPI